MDREHLAANRRNWDERAAIHAVSRTYDLAGYVADPERISTIVAFDRPWLGDITGQRTIHLQCHIGTDTLSLARLGAEVTGLDQSPASLEVARRLFADTSTPGTFVEAGVYDALTHLTPLSFDLVYTGVGALCWLDDIERWAAIVQGLLKPGGRLVMREGHPVLWALDDERDDDLLVLRYPYFQTHAPMTFDDPTTYTDGEQTISNARTYEWNHGLGEIVTALLEQGLHLTALQEHRTLEWQFVPSMELLGQQWVYPPHQRDLVPCMYTLTAAKPHL